MGSIQLQLELRQHNNPVTISAYLSGTVVRADVEVGSVTAARRHLTGAGMNLVDPDRLSDVAFPLMDLPLLPGIADVVVNPSVELGPVWEVLANPPREGTPVSLTKTKSGRISLDWWDQDSAIQSAVADQSVTKLLFACGVPVVASPEVWDGIEPRAVVPLIVGEARLNTDRFIEITSSVPQILETSPLRGLFRISNTSFGVPLRYAADIDHAEGFQWAGSPPRFNDPPPEVPEFPADLGPGHLEDLPRFVTALSQNSAQLLVSESGKGRRVFALAALITMDALPALIICHPHRVWAWARHCELLGLTWTLGTNRSAQVRLITFHDLVARIRLPEFLALIIDGLDEPGSLTTETLTALSTLDGYVDCPRIGVCGTFPASAKVQTDILSTLRPVEFTRLTPPELRYPPPFEQRAQEHINAYLFHRTLAPNPERSYRRSGVVPLHPNVNYLQVVEQAVSRLSDTDSEALLEHFLTYAAVGPPAAMSPKIPTAVQMTHEYLHEGGTVAVLVSHPQASSLLKALLKPVTAPSFDSNVDQGVLERARQDHGCAIIRYDDTLPDLRKFDHVIVTAHPRDFTILDAAVGAAADDYGPNTVQLLHASPSTDDRSAMLAAVRWERGRMSALPHPITETERDFLLDARSF